MAVLSVVLLVLFIIVAILLVLLVLVQSEEGDSLGGLFAGGSSSVFGSRSGNMLTRASSVLGVLFLVLSFGMALLNRTPSDSGVEAAGRRASTEQENIDWWQNIPALDEETTPPVLEAAPAERDTATERVE
jgi:preprotein translocase subunit SecG